LAAVHLLSPATESTHSSFPKMFHEVSLRGVRCLPFPHSPSTRFPQFTTGCVMRVLYLEGGRLISRHLCLSTSILEPVMSFPVCGLFLSGLFFGRVRVWRARAARLLCGLCGCSFFSLFSIGHGFFVRSASTTVCRGFTRPQECKVP